MIENEIGVHEIEDGVTYCLDDECPDYSYDDLLEKTLGKNWEDDLCN